MPLRPLVRVLAQLPPRVASEKATSPKKLYASNSGAGLSVSYLFFSATVIEK